MAKHLQVAYVETGTSIYVLIRNADSLVYNGSGFEAYDVDNYASYAVLLAEEGASRYYSGSFPPLPAGLYHVTFFHVLGDDPRDVDDSVGSILIEWTGTEPFRLAALADALLDRADAVETSLTLRHAV